MLAVARCFSKLSKLALPGCKTVSSKSINSGNVNSDESPLQGIRILDLTRIVAGPYCSMILGDLGAEIIKIEKPGEGDESRKWGPLFRNQNRSLLCYFTSVNRNKKSVCVDIRTKEGRQIIYSLAEKSDILMENYVPGKLSKLKLGYEHLQEIAPHLIYCSISGYGPTGPYAKKPGYDVIAASVGGLMHITGPENGEPCKVGVAVTDLTTGLYAHGAILAALYHRTKTGKGQKIDCDLLSTQISCLINIGSSYLNAGREGKRWGTAHESIVPYEAFATKDGYITIGAASNDQFKDLCKRMGRPDLVHSDKFLSNETRVKNRKELLDILHKVVSSKTNKEWVEIFEGSQFPWGPINTVSEVFNNHHIKEIELVKTLRHVKEDVGDVSMVGPPVVFSNGGNFIRMPPPVLGQHTDEVLSEILGLNEEQLNDLKKKNIIE